MAKNGSRKKGRNRRDTKNFSLKEKAFGLIELGRPIEWSKSLLNMTIAMMMAFYVYSFQIDFGIFALGFASVASLWASLYALNDLTDWRLDAKHKVKKKRPIPSGKVSPSQALAFVIILLAFSFAVPFLLNNFLLFLALSVMLANQLLYTMEPFRLKSRKALDFVSGSMVNPIFRYFSGLVLFVPLGALLSTATPLLPLVFVVSMQFGGYTLYRLFSKKEDRKHKMQSSVATISEKTVKNLAYFAIGMAFLSYLLLLLNGVSGRELWLGYLPLQFIWAVILPLLFLPLLKDAILNPGKASMKNSYRAIYVANLAFIISNLGIFAVFP